MQFVHLVPEICCEMLNVNFLPPDGSIEWLSASWMLVARWKEAGRCKLQDFSSAMKRVSCKLYIQPSSQTLSVIRWEQTCPVPDAGCKMVAARKLSSLHHQCIRRAVVVEQWQVNYSARGSYTPSLIIGERKNQRQPGFYWLQGTSLTWHAESWGAFLAINLVNFWLLQEILTELWKPIWRFKYEEVVTQQSHESHAAQS